MEWWETVMTVENNQFGKNIKYLRSAYGETQLELALAIGLDSPNTIANYEKGERTPKPEIKKKLASHYRITEDELVHSDFSGMKVSSSQLGNKQEMIEMTLLMCPITCTEKAMKDPLFQKGYAAHMRALDAMKDGHAFADADYDMCIGAYSDSYDTYETPESLANILWWFVISELSMKNQWMIDGAEALSDKRVSKKDFYKNFYLKDCSFPDEGKLFGENELKDLKEMSESVVELLKELKKKAQYSNLADYYTALRYILGCVDNELTEAMNKVVGSEMIWAFAKLGNRYAKKFILLGIKYLRK